MPPAVSGGLAGVLAVVLVLVPLVLEPFWVGVLALGMAFSVALLSIRPVTGETNVVSLCQISFVGIGAIVGGRAFSMPHASKAGVVGIVLVAAFFIVLSNLVVDVLYGVIDPRVRLT